MIYCQLGYFYQSLSKINLSGLRNSLYWSKILNINKYSRNKYILDIGSGTGNVYDYLKNKNINFKNYSLLAFIGLNTDLVGDVLIIPLLFLIFLTFCSRYPRFNFDIFLKNHIYPNLLFQKWNGGFHHISSLNLRHN